MSLVNIIALMASQIIGWNAGDKDASITLTNANLTAEASGTKPTGLHGVRAVTGKTSGKWYFELEASGGPDGSEAGWLGLFPASTSVSSPDPDPGSVIVFSVDGTIKVAGTTTGVNGWSGISGLHDVIGIAVDLTEQLLWVRRNALNWNDNAAANPATGAEGVSFSALTSTTPLFPGLWIQDGQQYTANFGASGFAEAMPSGFSAWR